MGHPSPVHEQGAGLETEKPAQELITIWNASFAGSISAITAQQPPLA